MRETVGNIWDYLNPAIIVITTNGLVTPAGRAVLGRGVARQALAHYPDLPTRLGLLLRDRGNHVHYLGNGLVTFPVEESPWANPDLHLIERSAHELRALTDEQGWQLVVVPRPGCGGGGLVWRDVRPMLEPCFDDRFIVISAPA
jgi:hypothetical protein